jgi:hypothetical protein
MRSSCTRATAHAVHTREQPHAERESARSSCRRADRARTGVPGPRSHSLMSSERRVHPPSRGGRTGGECRGDEPSTGAGGSRSKDPGRLPRPGRAPPHSRREHRHWSLAGSGPKDPRGASGGRDAPCHREVRDARAVKRVRQARGGHEKRAAGGAAGWRERGNERGACHVRWRGRRARGRRGAMVYIDKWESFMEAAQQVRPPRASGGCAARAGVVADAGLRGPPRSDRPHPPGLHLPRTVAEPSQARGSPPATLARESLLSCVWRVACVHVPNCSALHQRSRAHAVPRQVPARGR